MEVQPRQKEDLEWLQERVAKERDAKQRDRYRIVLLALQGFGAVQVADKVGCARRTVQLEAGTPGLFAAQVAGRVLLRVKGNQG